VVSISRAKVRIALSVVGVLVNIATLEINSRSAVASSREMISLVKAEVQ
jgi:hypothetical protein